MISIVSVFVTFLYLSLTTRALYDNYNYQPDARNHLNDAWVRYTRVRRAQNVNLFQTIIKID